MRCPCARIGPGSASSGVVLVGGVVVADTPKHNVVFVDTSPPYLREDKRGKSLKVTSIGIRVRPRPPFSTTDWERCTFQPPELGHSLLTFADCFLMLHFARGLLEINLPSGQRIRGRRVMSFSLVLLKVAAVANWSRYRIVAGLVMNSSAVPLKTRRVGQRCTLNLSRAETSSRWCGVVVRRGGTASSGVVHVTCPWFKNTWSVTKSPRVAEQCGVNIHSLTRNSIPFNVVAVIV
ncbi:uncharacterized protein TNCV_173151 [Trichonephila clavipes]|nr:uncharacterized protein TNCV_173151 [Trichonephila clavipes]